MAWIIGVLHHDAVARRTEFESAFSDTIISGHLTIVASNCVPSPDTPFSDSEAVVDGWKRAHQTFSLSMGISDQGSTFLNRTHACEHHNSHFACDLNE